MLGAKVIGRAKLNLYLKVGPRREDGYHEICSVMQSLELCDELYFRRMACADGMVSLRCSDSSLPTGAENIVWTAIETFDAHTGVLAGGGIEVFINKRIPIGAGLAGGSADAAATLVAMNHIWELDLDRDALMAMGELVGSDVPFCIAGGTAIVRGRGDRVENLQSLPAYQVVLAAPDEEVSTAEVYRRFDGLSADELPDEDELDRSLDRMLEGIRNQDFQLICENMSNSLESATEAHERLADYTSTALQGGARAAMMTGSGPTVFALVTGLQEAAEVAWELGQKSPITIITSFAQRGAQVSA
jgi:4-diphosphocytidyl-2-C-methyl-D-erythritol kinase